MAGLTGLFRRGPTYYMRVVLPLDHLLRAKLNRAHHWMEFRFCCYLVPITITPSPLFGVSASDRNLLGVTEVSRIAMPDIEV